MAIVAPIVCAAIVAIPMIQGLHISRTKSCEPGLTTLPSSAPWDNMRQVHINFGSVEADDVFDDGAGYLMVDPNKTQKYLVEVGPNETQAAFCSLQRSRIEPTKGNGATVELQLIFDCTPRSVHISKYQKQVRSAFHKVDIQPSMTVNIPFFSFVDNSPWWMPSIFRPAGPKKGVSIVGFLTGRDAKANLLLYDLNGAAFTYVGSGLLTNGTCAPMWIYVHPAEPATDNIQSACTKIAPPKAASDENNVRLAWVGTNSAMEVTQYSADVQMRRNKKYGILIILVLGIGFCWAVHYEKCCLNCDMLDMVIWFIGGGSVGLAPLYPWIALWCGQVICGDAMPWEIHLLYACSLAFAAPVLAGEPEMWGGAVPVLGLKGTPFHIYHYGVTLLNAADQYLDACSGAVAYGCGWERAWLLPTIFLAGLVAQALAVGMLTHHVCNVLVATMGFSMDGFDMVQNRSLLIENAKKTAAVLGITRFFTESLPQSYLQWRFCQDVKASNLVVVSIALSMLMGLKAMLTGGRYFCYGMGYETIE